MKNFIIGLSFLLVGCTALDEITVVDFQSPIEYKIVDLDNADTKATLVTTSNLASQYPTMVVDVVSDDVLQFSQDLDTQSKATSDKRYWSNGQSLVFYSYPKDALTDANGIAYSDGEMSFHYKASTNSTDTPDLLIAMAQASYTSRVVSLDYKHAFAAVCVKYEEMQSAHTIKKVVVENAYTEGDCRICNVSSPYVEWSSQSSKTTLTDSKSRGVYYNGQLITEDGFIFMIVPKNGEAFNVKVWVDDIAEPAQFTYTFDTNKGGQLITFNIKDKDKTPSTDPEPDVKHLNKNADGTYSIVIDAYVTGSISTVTKTMPTNTIFVLDVSGSMSENLTDDPLAFHERTGNAVKGYKYTNDGFDTLDKVKGAEVGYYAANVSAFKTLRDARYYSGHWQFHNETTNKWVDIEDTAWTVRIYRRKIAMMQSVCKDYVETLASTGKEHYVSVVSFGSSSSILCSKVDVRSGKATIISAINSLSANGGTYIDAGFDNARTLLMNPANYYNAMVAITDGEPGLTTFNKSVANSAIQKSEDCKNTYSAYVYSIGIFGKETPSSKCISFLDRLSSNYKDATTYENGTKTADGYYSLASSEKAIGDVMKSIQKEVQEGGASVQLGVDSYMMDVVSDVFEIPQYGQVVIKQANWISGTTFGPEYDVDSSVTWTLDGTKEKGYTLKVTGFDYSKYFCGTGNPNGGRKLVIHINNLVLNEDAPAGSYTNESGSGLYDSGGNLVDEFNYPRI